ncbi:MAG: tetratricopeptide repeat protein, partial [Bacteroidia bacterium]
MKSRSEISRRHVSIPRIMISRNITFPAIMIVISLIIIFNWSSVNRILGFGNSKREDALSHIYRGEEFFYLKDYNAAKAEFESAAEIDPGYSVAWSNLAAVCINQDNLGEAIMHTIKAIELDENNIKAAYNLAYALDDRNDYLQASEWYSRAIEMDSTFLPAYSALGRVYNLSGKPVDAILILNRALKRFPESDSLYLVNRNIGYSYFLIDQFNESIKHLNYS